MPVIRNGTYKARYSIGPPKKIKGISLALPNLVQEDHYSCGYMAVLTVSEYLQTGFSAESVLGLVKPCPYTGTSQRRVRSALGKIGIRATYREDLTIIDLVTYILAKAPVIISVWPDWWLGDHWCVVRGFSSNRVYLSNHYSLSLKGFHREWVENWEEGTKGAGIICERSCQ